MRKETAVIAIIVAAVAGFFVGSMTAKKGEGGDQAGEGDGAIGAAGTEGAEGGNPDLYRVPVGNSPFKGERDALVTIVEFSDFQ